MQQRPKRSPSPLSLRSSFPSLATLAPLAVASAMVHAPVAHAQPAARAGVAPLFSRTTQQSFVEFGYALPSPVQLEAQEFGDVDTTSVQISHQISIPTSDSFALLTGIAWRGTWFDVPGAAPIPDSLHEASIRLGANWQFADAWRLQLLVSPGLYSDFKDIDAGDIYVPGLALVFWEVSPSLQLIGGTSVNLQRDIPIIPAIGGVWRFAPDWSLLAIFPTPRIEYAVSDSVTVFAGAELVRTAYRVSQDFGTEFGRPELNDEDLSYNEWRVGAGVRWRLSSSLRLSLDGGWMGDREFNFEEADVELDGEGAPYFQISLGGTY